MVVISSIDEFFNYNLLLTSCVHTAGQYVELISGQLVRVRALSAKQANLIMDRSISSHTIIGSVNVQMSYSLKDWNCNFFLKRIGHTRPLYHYFRLFNTQFTVNKSLI